MTTRCVGAPSLRMEHGKGRRKLWTVEWHDGSLDEFGRLMLTHLWTERAVPDRLIAALRSEENQYRLIHNVECATGGFFRAGQSPCFTAMAIIYELHCELNVLLRVVPLEGVIAYKTNYRHADGSYVIRMADMVQWARANAFAADLTEAEP